VQHSRANAKPKLRPFRSTDADPSADPPAAAAAAAAAAAGWFDEAWTLLVEDTCPVCATRLTSAELLAGRPTDPNDYTITCASATCTARFVSRFSVSNSQQHHTGEPTPTTWCMCLSPCVLRKEIATIVQRSEALADSDSVTLIGAERFRAERADIFWNLVGHPLPAPNGGSP
jgi:hypothetical protein